MIKYIARSEDGTFTYAGKNFYSLVLPGLPVDVGLLDDLTSLERRLHGTIERGLSLDGDIKSRTFFVHDERSPSHVIITSEEDISKLVSHGLDKQRTRDALVHFAGELKHTAVYSNEKEITFFADMHRKRTGVLGILESVCVLPSESKERDRQKILARFYSSFLLFEQGMNAEEALGKARARYEC